MNDTLEIGNIVGLASEGQGIVRQEGLVTFIPFTAQGDRVEFQTTHRKKNFALGKLLKIVVPSQERTMPLCQYYEICGGCQLQHIKYEAQIEYKRKWIEDALKKIGKFQEISVPPLMPANLRWGYRRRVNLVLKCHHYTFQAGYIATDNKSLIAIENCPIFTNEKDPILKAIQKISSQLKSSDSRDGKVTILKDQLGYIVHFHFKNMPKNAFEVLSNCRKIYPFITGILASSQKKIFEFGVIDTSCEIDQLSFNFTPKTFIQNHPEQSLNIYKTIEHLTQRLKPKSILDLYCGIGISSLLLAKQAGKIKGVELNPQSIELAKLNAKKNNLTHIQFLIADVEQVLAQLIEKDKPDLIIVNPPREGLSAKVTQILKSQPIKNLIYISCMPSTLARDLKILCENNYQLTSVQAFDMFPQTVHVETLAVLQTKP